MLRTTSLLAALGLMLALPRLAAADGAPVAAPPSASETAGAAGTENVAAAPSFLGRFKPTVDLRARAEFGDQDTRDESMSWTVRGRFGLQAQISEEWTSFAEIEHTRTPDRQSYQAGSVHGLGQNKVVIADPESFELNQLWLAYTGNGLAAKAGIQRVIIDNARFVGNVGWRQNEQTYDGVTLAYSGIEKVELKYGYLYNVRRIFGTERKRAPAQKDYDSRSHYVTASYAPSPALKLTGYGFLLDLENAAGATDSNDTLGASLTGVVPTGPAQLSYRLEYAMQRDAADNPRDYRADYLHAYTNAKLEKFDFGVGYEVLGAGDGVGFNTPLATLHAFNGFADTFLVTPNIGLRDFYVEVGTSALPFGFTARAIYHDFKAEDDGTDLGYEIDFVVAKPLPWNMKSLLKAAFYEAEEGNFLDTQRLTFQVEYTY